MIRLDIAYAHGLSFSTDVRILAKTIPVIIGELVERSVQRRQMGSEHMNAQVARKNT